MNILLNFVQNPGAEINAIMQNRRISFALLGYACGALSLMMSIALENLGNYGMIAFIAGFIGLLVFNLLVGFFFAASAHLLMELTGGKSSAAGLFVLLGLSEIAKTLLVAFAISAVAFPGLLAMRPLAVLAVLGLQIFFVIYMMQKAYGITKTHTFFAMMASFMPSIISLFAVGFLFMGFLFWIILK